MKVKFKKRYVLGTGYPWVRGQGPSSYKEICLSFSEKGPTGLDTVFLEWPEELWSQDLPQYRLVLERVEKGEKK